MQGTQNFCLLCVVCVGLMSSILVKKRTGGCWDVEERGPAKPLASFPPRHPALNPKPKI